MRVYIDLGGGNHLSVRVPVSAFYDVWTGGTGGGAGAKVKLGTRVYKVYAWGMQDRTWYGWL